jgi:hypothetical protein
VVLEESSSVLGVAKNGFENFVVRLVGVVRCVVVVGGGGGGRRCGRAVLVGGFVAGTCFSGGHFREMGKRGSEKRDERGCARE